MTERARNIVIAVALAGIAALLTGLYVTSYQRQVQQGEEHVTVFVASRDIPAGTSGADAVARGLVTHKTVTRNGVVPGAVSNTDQITGLVAAQQIFAGEQITKLRFSRDAVQGIQGQLTGTTRAFQVQGDANQLLAGTLRTGDHVDLVATFKYHLVGSASSESFFATRTVLRDLKVLRAPAGVGADGKITSGFGDHVSVVLAVTDTQAQKLDFTITNASNNNSTGGGWSLALRAPLKADDSPENVVTLGSVLRDGLRPGQASQLYGGKVGGGQ
ncbi:MAG: Flp pilus assembly protein CpaB [Actinomycetia bacterium]|nr:Flp pilus assembly protein CpaB [Actinomycetes bacterium]